MREAITVSKVPPFQHGEQSTFRIPMGIPVTVPNDEDYSSNAKSTTTGQDQDKLSDDDDVKNPLSGKEDFGMGTLSPEQKQQQYDGEITKYAQTSCLLTFNLNELWIKMSKYADLSADSYDNAQVRDAQNKNRILAAQMTGLFVFSVFHMMDWNLKYFPHWSIQGTLIGNTLGVLWANKFF